MKKTESQVVSVEASSSVRAEKGSSGALELSDEQLAEVAGGMYKLELHTSYSFCTWSWLGC